MTTAGTPREQGRTCLLTMRRVINAAESGTIAIFFGAESTSGEGSSQGNASCAHLRALSVSLPLVLPERWPTARAISAGGFECRRRENGGNKSGGLFTCIQDGRSFSQQHIVLSEFRGMNFQVVYRRFGRQVRRVTIVVLVMVQNKCCWPSTNQLSLHHVG